MNERGSERGKRMLDAMRASGSGSPDARWRKKCDWLANSIIRGMEIDTIGMSGEVRRTMMSTTGVVVEGMILAIRPSGTERMA